MQENHSRKPDQILYKKRTFRINFSFFVERKTLFINILSILFNAKDVYKQFDHFI